MNMLENVGPVFLTNIVVCPVAYNGAGGRHFVDICFVMLY